MTLLGAAFMTAGLLRRVNLGAADADATAFGGFEDTATGLTRAGATTEPVSTEGEVSRVISTGGFAAARGAGDSAVVTLSALG